MRSKQKRNIDALAQRWQASCKRPFPSGYAGEEVAGIDLASLDSYAAGCISTFIGNRGWLDHERHAILQQCFSELDTVVPQLKGEAHDYFAELRNDVQQVVQCL